MKEVSNILTAATDKEEQKMDERILLDVCSSFSVLARILQLAYLEISGIYMSYLLRSFTDLECSLPE